MGDTARQGLKQQILSLDNRFWIVNVMEMFERLAYYGVRSVVAIYMVLAVELGGPEFSHVQKGWIFAAWAAVQSLLPAFTGGYADRYGHKNTVAVAIVLKIVGYVMMGMFQDYWGFFSGAMFLAAGTAVFKPGVQGTLASSLKQGNASVGWGIFYQLVNIGGFLGPVLAGVLRLMDWQYVFYACGGIVAINFLWLPFYQEPTEEEEHGDLDEQAETWGAWSRTLSRRFIWTWAALLLGGAVGFVAFSPWTSVAFAAFGAVFVLFGLFKERFDAGRNDPFAIFVLSVVGLFQHRVLWFCIVFSGFWLMFNQVFDLLPNVIDDWIDTSGIIATLGEAFSNPLVPTALAVVLGLVYGGVCAAGVFLAMRPDRRSVADVPAPAWVVVALAILGAVWLPATLMASGGTVWAASVPAAGALALTAARLQLSSKAVTLPTFLVGAIGAFLAIRQEALAAAPELQALAAEGAQVNPEWMINLNPGLIVFTMVFFGYLTSFLRPLTSIIVGMVVATTGAYLAGTATFGWLCLGGIAVFSIGEMLSSPKKMEYLSGLAPKGQKALFMGYANVPVAIGWIAGSLFAGSAYDEHGDKAHLARKHLADVVGMEPSKVEAIERSDVMTVLAAKLDTTVAGARQVLLDTYDPQAIWWDIALIGLGSIVAMFVYDRVLRFIDRKRGTA
ncbi:MAG: MFS transporter [Myxococcota bacterium]